MNYNGPYEDNDIDVSIAENRSHIEGDDVRLQNIEADLKRAVQITDIHVEYDREGGIGLEIDDGGAESEGS